MARPAINPFFTPPTRNPLGRPGGRWDAASEALARSVRYQTVLLPLLTARTPETRAARLAAAVERLVEGAAGARP